MIEFDNLPPDQQKEILAAQEAEWAPTEADREALEDLLKGLKQESLGKVNYLGSFLGDDSESTRDAMGEEGE